MMVYICTKVNENILMGIKVMERTQKVNGRTEGCPYRQMARHNTTHLLQANKNISPRSALMHKNSLSEGQL